jgi:hypothetical protein
VDHCSGIWPCGHDLGVNGIFAVALPATFEHLPVGVDEVDPIRSDLGETPFGLLDPHSTVLWVADGGVAPDEVVVSLGCENPGGCGDKVAKVVDHRGHPRLGRPIWAR